MELIRRSKQEPSFWESRQAEACPLCGGSGFRLVEQDGQTLARKCRCISKERINLLRVNSRIPAFHCKESLEKFHPHSLEEIWLVDFLKDFLNERELPVLQLWIVSAEANARRILCGFANDLIQLLGYSCLWINCSAFDETPLAFSYHRRDRFTWPGIREDFVFLENYRASKLRHKQQQRLEEVLWERVRWGKSTFFLGPSPRSLMESHDWFSDQDLSKVFLKRFKIIEHGKGQDHSENSRWLF
jgi:hypothetical protein